MSSIETWKKSVREIGIMAERLYTSDVDVSRCMQEKVTVALSVRNEKW